MFRNALGEMVGLPAETISEWFRHRRRIAKKNINVIFILLHIQIIRKIQKITSFMSKRFGNFL